MKFISSFGTISSLASEVRVSEPRSSSNCNLLDAGNHSIAHGAHATPRYGVVLELISSKSTQRKVIVYSLTHFLHLHHPHLFLRLPRSSSTRKSQAVPVLHRAVSQRKEGLKKKAQQDYLEGSVTESSESCKRKIRVAVVSSGVAGLAAARTLAQSGANVVLYEKDGHIGGHANTVHVDGIALDLGFMVFNQVTYPNMVAFFNEIGVEMEKSNMSFSISLDGGKGCEWGSSSVGGLFAQKTNAINPFFWNMIREMLRFKADVIAYLEKIECTNAEVDETATLGEFLELHGYSQKFKECYLIPVCASIWSCSSQQVLGFSGVSILTFLRNHHVLQLFGRPQWITVKGRSETYEQGCR
ncbi:hypothetical protein R1flu_023622 [Riccia fluitans]|uniref:Amine oxidase domain-containing protein n=1 Tax=Riccia fluitans TaxID=41844 RepID=A0ABD1XSJ3_9MARC